MIIRDTEALRLLVDLQRMRAEADQWLILLQRMRADLDRSVNTVNEIIQREDLVAPPAAARGAAARQLEFGQLIDKREIANPNQVREIDADSMDQKNIVTRYAVPPTAETVGADDQATVATPAEDTGDAETKAPPCETEQPLPPPDDEIPF